MCICSGTGLQASQKNIKKQAKIIYVLNWNPQGPRRISLNICFINAVHLSKVESSPAESLEDEQSAILAFNSGA